MEYRRPSYVPALLNDPHLKYKWDDWRASQDFTFDASGILADLASLTLRAKITAGIGMFDWIVWRFQSLTEDVTPFQLSEAAWCANVDKRYMEFWEFDRDEWMGPIRGPIWCAMTWLISMVLLSDDDPDECESGLAYLASLAMHVLPEPAAFEDWLQRSIDRLRIYPATPDEPFEDLFSEREEERRGPLIPREILDLRFEFDPTLTDTLTARFIEQVDYRSNPFLKAPEQLIAEGFPGSPYRVEPGPALPSQPS